MNPPTCNHPLIKPRGLLKAFRPGPSAMRHAGRGEWICPVCGIVARETRPTKPKRRQPARRQPETGPAAKRRELPAVVIIFGRMALAAAGALALAFFLVLVMG